MIHNFYCFIWREIMFFSGDMSSYPFCLSFRTRSFSSWVSLVLKLMTFFLFSHHHSIEYPDAPPLRLNSQMCIPWNWPGIVSLWIWTPRKGFGVTYGWNSHGAGHLQPYGNLFYSRLAKWRVITSPPHFRYLDTHIWVNWAVCFWRRSRGNRVKVPIWDFKLF